MSEFKKNDEGKPTYELLPITLLSDVNLILKHGAKKYGLNNWKKPDFKASRCYNATLRHLFSFWGGENIDKESGLSHIDHAICNLLFIKYHMLNTPAADYRPLTIEDENANILRSKGECENETF